MSRRSLEFFKSNVTCPTFPELETSLQRTCPETHTDKHMHIHNSNNSSNNRTDPLRESIVLGTVVCIPRP